MTRCGTGVPGVRKAHIGGGRAETGRRQDKRNRNGEQGSEKKNRPIRMDELRDKVLHEIPKLHRGLKRDFVAALQENRIIPEAVFAFLPEPTASRQWKDIHEFLESRGRTKEKRSNEKTEMATA